MKTALVTGFETFGKYVFNPSKWLSLSVDGKTIADYKIHSLVFPSIVRFPEDAQNPGAIVVKKAQEIGADLIISFGIASDVKGFRIERSATNWIYNEKYCQEYENNRPLDSSKPDKEQIQNDLSNWDIKKMQNLFREANIPFDSTISDDPGQFCCNALIYQTLRAMTKKEIKIPYLFIHCACTEESIELIQDFDRNNKIIIKKEDMKKALEIILHCHKN
jgi:pyrrolidone-carboxylate peptidase